MYPLTLDGFSFGFTVKSYLERISLLNSKEALVQFITPFGYLPNHVAFLPFPNAVGIFGASPDASSTRLSTVSQLFKSNAISRSLLHVGPIINGTLHISLDRPGLHLPEEGLVYFKIPRRTSSFNQARIPMWGFSNGRIQVGSFDFGMLKYITLETKLQHVYVPYLVKKDLLRAFGKPESFPCEEIASLPRFKIILGGKQLHLDPSCFIKKTADQCELYFEISGEDPLVILPIGFFKNNQVVLDYENNRIGVVFENLEELPVVSPPPMLSQNSPNARIQPLIFIFSYFFRGYLFKKLNLPF